MAMTPRQASIRAYFLERDKAIDQVRMFTVMRLAFGGEQKAIDDWMATLDLPS